MVTKVRHFLRYLGHHSRTQADRDPGRAGRQPARLHIAEGTRRRPRPGDTGNK